MASRSSSTDSTSNSSLSEDGISEVMIVDPRRTLESERFFFIEKRLHIDNSHDEKGKAIISSTGNFHEITGGKVVPTKFFKAESAHMAATNNPKATQEFEIDGARAPKIECGCCYCEFQLETMVHCSNGGHMFCFKCLNRRVKEITFGGYKVYSSLSCMATGGGCNESISLSEIQRALPNDVIQRYEERQAQEAVAQANLEGLVYCPFCNVPYEVDECAKVLDCPNPKCLRDSCIKCKKMSHLSLWCEEFERINNAPLLMEVEERMAKAVIRECNICHVRFLKGNECNKVKCRCGNTMCYVCRQTISSLDIIHFCDCYPASTELVKSCPRCNKCSFLWYEREDNEALAAKEEALKELAGRDPKLLDLEIGPPFEKLRKQVLPTEEHRPRKYQRIERSPASSPGLLRHAVERTVMVESPVSTPAILFREAMERAFMVETPPSNPTTLPEEGNRRANMSESPSSSPTSTAVSSANMVGPSNEGIGIERATMVESPPSIPTILLREGIQFATLLESPTSSPPRILFPESIQHGTMVESATSTPRILFLEGTRRATMVESPRLSPRILFREGVEAANMQVETSPFTPAQFFIDEDEPTNVVERPPRVSTHDEQ